MGINMSNKSYFLKNSERTKKRLEQMNDLGMEEVGYGQFGIEGLMSGLYIEKVWNYSDEDFESYLDWVKELKASKLKGSDTMPKEKEVQRYKNINTKCPNTKGKHLRFYEYEGSLTIVIDPKGESGGLDVTLNKADVEYLAIWLGLTELK